MKAGALILAAFLSGCALPPAAPQQGAAAELAGRSPGAPQRCVSIVQSDSLRIAEGDRHTLLYGNGKTVWANHLGSQCGFGSNDVLVTEPIGPNYCRGDLVRSFDRLSRIPGPACVLGDFVPYTR